MKLSCCSWSYHRALEAKRIDFTTWLRICAEDLGVGGVDIIAEQMPKRTKRCWLDIKKRCTDLQLTIVSLSPGNNFGAPMARERKRHVENVRRWIETAYIMGAPCLRIFAGWPPKGQAKRLWPKMVQCIRQVAKTAEQAGVTIVVEPHNDDGFLPNSRSTLQLIQELNSPWVRINLDTGNYHEPNVYAGLDASLAYAPHVVAKIHELTPDGEAEGFDYDKIVSMLKRRHYRGFLTIEYEGKEDELTAVPKAVTLLRRCATTHEL